MNPQKGPFARILTVCALFAIAPVMQIVVSTGAVFIYRFVQGEALQVEELLNFVNVYTMGLLLLANFLVLLLLFSIWTLRRRNFFAACGLSNKTTMPIVMLSLLMGVAANIWFSFMINLLPIPEQLLEGYSQASSTIETGPVWIAVLSLLIGAPLVEEVLYRGLIYGQLRTFLPTALAVGVQAFLFGLIHGNPVWIAYAAVLGIVLGYLRVVTGSLWPPLLFHISFNAGSYLFGYFVVSYGENHTVMTLLLLGSAALFLLTLYGVYYRSDDRENTQQRSE